MAPLYQRQAVPSAPSHSHQSPPSFLQSSQAPMNATLGDGYLPDSPPHHNYSPPHPRPSSRTSDTAHPMYQDRVSTADAPTSALQSTSRYTANPYNSNTDPFPSSNNRLEQQRQFGGSAALSSIQRNTAADAASLNTTIEDTYVAPQLRPKASSPPRGPASYNSPPPKTMVSHSQIYSTSSSPPVASTPYTAMTTSPQRHLQPPINPSTTATTVLRSPSVSTYPSIAVQGPSSTRIQRFPLRARQGSRSVSRGGSMSGGTPMMMPLGANNTAATGATLSVGGRPAERTLLYSPEGGLRAPPPFYDPMSSSSLHHASPLHGNSHLFPAYKQPVDRNFLSPLRSPSRRRSGNH